MGDYNFPEINWKANKSEASPDHPASTFLKAIQDGYLIQLQAEPTRFREGQKSNTVDLVFVNREDIVEDIVTTAGIGKSDHFVLKIGLNFTYDTTPRVIRYNYAKTNFDTLTQEISSTDWDDELSSCSTNEAWLLFKQKLFEAINKSTPQSRSTGRRGKGWMDKPTLESVRLKHKLFRKWKQTREDEDYTRYLKARNRARKDCRKAKIRQEEQVAKDSKENPRVFWNFIKSKTRSRSGIADLVMDTGRKTSSDQEKAETLNEHFQRVFTHEDTCPLPAPPIYDYSQVLDDIIISEEEVRKVLKNLHTGKAPGPDGISPQILARAADVLAQPLTLIFKLSLSSGEIPEDWRQATVTPIFKKGSRSDACNYRPVSLTCITCKCLEKIIRDRILNHLIASKIISKNQHGFVPGRSCTTQLLEVLDDWTNTLDNGGSIDAIYMDFQKAFDTVPHRRLLHKVASTGVLGNILRWIGAFLRSRKQRVLVNGSLSQTVAVTSGIPQGSVIGPLLFVIFINDLPVGISQNSTLKMFADDTKIYTRSDNEGTTKTLQEDVAKLENWSNKWLLKFHPKKCTVLKLGKRKSDTKYYMSGLNSDGANGRLELKETEVEKDLGVTIDSKLTFRQHVDQCTSKANRMLGIIRRSFDHLNSDTFTQLFKSLVRPLLEYGHTVWQPHHKTLCSDLENVQRRATKLLASLRDKPYPDRLKALHLPTLEHRRIRGDMIETYKILHGYYSTDKPMLHLAEIRHRGNSLKLQKNRFQLHIRGNFFANRVINSWNGLPDSVVSAPNLNVFKSRLDSYWKNSPTLYHPVCQE